MTGQAAEGSTPTESGLKILPYSLGSALASMPVAWFLGFWQKRTCDTSGQNRVISAGLLISTLGFGKAKVLSISIMKLIEAIYRIVNFDGRKCSHLFANTVPTDFWNRYWHAFPLPLPSISQDAGSE